MGSVRARPPETTRPGVVSGRSPPRGWCGRRLVAVLVAAWADDRTAVGPVLEALKGAVQVESLPPYAPELNPAEYIWGHLKHHELPNRCAQNMTDLKTNTRNRLRSMQRRSTLVRAFWQQAELAL